MKDRLIADSVDTYRRLSPRLEFAAGGPPMQNLLLKLSDDAEDYKFLNTEDSVATGWIALEAGAHLPAGSARAEQVEEASKRFLWLAGNAISSALDNQLDSYAARVGLAAAYAYQEDTAAAIEDGPGYYSAILEDVLNDKTFMLTNPSEYRGLVSELTCATLASHLGYLTLPTSTRHDKPFKPRTPSYAHDLQIWLDSPTSLPARPERKVQVKTTYHSSSLRYAPQITMVSINDDFRQKYRDQLAISLVKFYKGERLDARDYMCVGQNGERLNEILHEPLPPPSNPRCRVRRILAMKAQLFGLPCQRDGEIESRSDARLGTL